MTTFVTQLMMIIHNFLRACVYFLFYFVFSYIVSLSISLSVLVRITPTAKKKKTTISPPARKIKNVG